MSIDDLKAKQKAALESEAAWQSVRKDLEAKLKAADLASVETELKAKTGLELRISRSSELPHFSSSVHSCSIRRGEWFTLHVPGVKLRVLVETIGCSIAGHEDGSWMAHLTETVSDHGLKLDVAMPKPCIPVRIWSQGRKRNVWWCGPEDNSKLVEALVDALSKNDRPSEFTLKGPTGCGLVLAIGLTGLALAVALLTL